MSILTISLTTVFLLTIVGCNNEAADSKEQMKGAVSLGSEITLEGELPSILTSGLSPEEKSKLTDGLTRRSKARREISKIERKS